MQQQRIKQQVGTLEMFDHNFEESNGLLHCSISSFGAVLLA